MDQKRIMGALQTVADENGVTLDTVMEEIEKVIDMGMESKAPLVRRRWDAIPCQGDRPTVVELVDHLVGQVLCGGMMLPE